MEGPFSILSDEPGPGFVRRGKPFHQIKSAQALCDVKNVLVAKKTIKKIDGFKSSGSSCKNPSKEIAAPVLCDKENVTVSCGTEDDVFYDYCGKCGLGEDGDDDFLLNHVRPLSERFNNDDIKYLKEGLLGWCPPSLKVRQEVEVTDEDIFNDFPEFTLHDIALPKDDFVDSMYLDPLLKEIHSS